MLTTLFLVLRTNLYILFQVICLYWLTQRRWSVKRTCALLAGYAVVQQVYYWLTLTIMSAVGFPLYSVLYHPVSKMPLCVIAAVLLSKYRGWRALFTGLTTISLMYFGDTIASMLFPFYSKSGLISVKALFWNLMLKLIVYLFLLLLVRLFLARPLLLLQALLPQYWRELCLLPCAFIFLIAIIFMPVTGESFDSRAVLISLLFLLFLIFYYIIWRLVQTGQRLKMAEHDRQVFSTQVEALHAHEKQVQSLYDSLRIYRHDLRHYITIMADTLQKNQSTEECMAMLDHLYELVQSSSLVTYTNDFNASSLISHYTERAKQRGIRVEAQLELPSDFTVNKYEFLVAIGNALENAVQASSQVEDPENRLIRLSGKVCGSQYLYEISNTYQTPPRFDPLSHLPVTDDPNHGLGTRSIKAFAQKYGGMVQFDLVDNLFRMRLLFTPAADETPPR